MIDYEAERLDSEKDSERRRRLRAFLMNCRSRLAARRCNFSRRKK
jgi:hypothetical protein